MALVDYSSSDSSSEPDAPVAQQQEQPQQPQQQQQQQPPPAKKRKTVRSATTASPGRPTLAIASPERSTASTAAPTQTPLPPLPAAFHNLYAHTTRPAPTDAPSLHQGRRRAIPHVEGHWPSHIAVEWHPTPAAHAVLTELHGALAAELGPLLTAHDDDARLTSFLASDLHAPLPLHISLSRPFVLRTGERAGFLAEAVREIARAEPSARGCELRVAGLGWFRSREGGRSFLVLRVRSSASGGEGDKGRNPELSALLARCNDLVAAYGQPRLYARAESRGENAEDGMGDDNVGHRVADDDGGVQPAGDEEDGAGVDDAFHVSIAWSFAVPTPGIRARTAAVFAREEFQRRVVEGTRIPVTDVKVKIGNVVTSVPLDGSGRKRSGSGLFGI